jgi:hypothetical protein
MTGRTRFLAYLYIALCGGLLVAGGLLCLGIVLSSDPARERALEFIGPLYLALSAFYFIPGTLGGLGLLRGKRWSRAVIIVLSLLVVLIFPVGTALGGFGLWALLGSDSKHSAPASGEPAQTPPVARTPSPLRTRGDDSRYAGLLVAMAAVAAAFVVAIGTGFRVTHTASSPISDSTYYGSIAVLVLVVVIAVKSGWLRSVRLPPAVPLRTTEYDPDGFADERRQADEARAVRLAHLDADPVRRRYADRIRRGQWWSDEMIEYDLDRAPTAQIACDEHGFRIDVVHKSVADRDTPWFPVDSREREVVPNET